MTAVAKIFESLPETPASMPAEQGSGRRPGMASPCSAPLPPAMAFPRRLSPPDASRYLVEVWGVRRTVTTLAKLRCVGGGPVFRKIRRDVIYAPADIDSWVASLMSAPCERTGDADG